MTPEYAEKPRRKIRPRGLKVRYGRFGRFETVSKSKGTRLLNDQAQRLLNMSGQEFRRQYKLGLIKDSEDSRVSRVAALLPFAEE